MEFVVWFEKSAAVGISQNTLIKSIDNGMKFNCFRRKIKLGETGDWMIFMECYKENH